DLSTNKVTTHRTERIQSLAEFLGVKSLIVTPFQYRERLHGHFIVGSGRSDAFDIGDAVFLMQFANQPLPIIENIRLVDCLAANASEAERQRIARSVHDRVIQPYYGLQIGLKALDDLLESMVLPRQDNGPVRTSGTPTVLLKQLMIMTSEGIRELR